MSSLRTCADELTKCAICLDDLVNPKSLPCLHTFCLECIKGHCKDNSPGDQVDCPVCRATFVIPLPGVEQLKCNFLINSLVAAKQASGGTKKPGQILCDVCSEDGDTNPSGVSDATACCTGCGQRLCDRCSKTHQKIPGGSHSVFPFGSSIAEDNRKLQGSFCDVHPGSKVEIHCNTCHTNLCQTCCIVKHKSHDCKLIIDVCKTFAETLSRDVEQVAAKESSILREIGRLELNQKDYDNGVDSIEIELRATANEIKRRIDEAVDQLTAKLSDQKDAAAKITNIMRTDLELAVAASQSFMRYYLEILSSGRPDDVTQAFNYLHERANELIQRDLKTDDLCLPEVKASTNDLYDAVAEVIMDKSPICRKRTDKLSTRMMKLAATDKLTLVRSLKEGKTILALATLNREIFVYHDVDTDVTVYDAVTYDIRRRLRVPRLGCARDMTSCNRYRCIYISDWKSKVVHRVDDKYSITQWSVNDEPQGLSVNSVHSVLVTCSVVGKIKEFTTDGKILRTITLQVDVVNPWHAVELTTETYAVCHGLDSNPLNRVCIVDSLGRVERSYGDRPGSKSGQLNVPIRLAVIDGLILVMDRFNRRVMMLSESLSSARELVSGLRDPCRMWFDEEAGRLYVADNKLENNKYVGGHVAMYSV